MKTKICGKCGGFIGDPHSISCVECKPPMKKDTKEIKFKNGSRIEFVGEMTLLCNQPRRTAKLTGKTTLRGGNFTYYPIIIV